VLVDLLVAMGLRVVRLPSHGVAERGLDIAAVGRIGDEPRTLYLIQVKQGDITRAVWNQGANAVRQSLDDLEDFSEEALDLAGRPAPKRTVLVLAHNGMVAANVESTFVAHRKKIRRRSKLEVEHWHLHALVEMFEKHLFDEHFFSAEQAALIRKVLAFVEVPEYDLRHFTKFLALTIPNASVSRKAGERVLLQIQIALAMFYHYGSIEGGNHDVALRAYEIALLRVYGWLHRDRLFADSRLAEQLTRTINHYFVVSIEYLAKLDPLLNVYHGLARTGWQEAVEYPLRALKIGAFASQWMIFLGRISSKGQLPEELKASAEFVANFLTRLRSSCPPIERPLFDHQMTEVCLTAIGFRVSGGPVAATDYLNSVISRLCLESMNGNPLPEGSGDFEAVAKLLMDSEVVEWYSKASSTLLPMLAEMCALLDAEPLYELVHRTWQGKVNLQLIYLNGRFLEWACNGGHPAADDDERNENSILLPPTAAEFRAEIDRKRTLDDDFARLFNLPFFELIMHIACRAYRLRFSPTVWRALRISAAEAATEPATDSHIGRA
jgi:hypothetical protein